MKDSKWLRSARMALNTNGTEQGGYEEICEPASVQTAPLCTPFSVCRCGIDAVLMRY